MRIEILNPQGEVVNTIIASEEFAEEHYPGAWRLAEYQDPEPNARDLILQVIERLEYRQLMPRITREAILRMAEKEAAELAEQLGVDEALLLSKNKGYTALKAFDSQIASLRDQLNS